MNTLKDLKVHTNLSGTVESVYNELCYNEIDLITKNKKKLSDSCIKIC